MQSSRGKKIHSGGGGGGTHPVPKGMLAAVPGYNATLDKGCRLPQSAFGGTGSGNLTEPFL